MCPKFTVYAYTERVAFLVYAYTIRFTLTVYTYTKNVTLDPDPHFGCMHTPEKFLTLSTIALSVYAYIERVAISVYAYTVSVTFSMYAYTESAISKSIFAANSNLYANRYFYRKSEPQEEKMSHKKRPKILGVPSTFLHLYTLIYRQRINGGP